MITPGDLYHRIGLNIRQARTQARLTQAQLAASVRLTRTSINNIEHGRQRLLVHTLVDIVNACRVVPESLLASEGRIPDVPPDLEDWFQRITADKLAVGAKSRRKKPQSTRLATST